MLVTNWQPLTQIPTEPFLTWAKVQQLTSEKFNGLPTKRFEKWWGKQVELLNFGKTWNVTDAEPISSVPLLQDLCNCFYPQANSVLLYYYPIGVGISEHTDKTVFSPEVVLINLIDAPIDLFGLKPTINFRLNGQNKILEDGDVVRFYARTPHGVPPVKIPRFSLSLRVVQ